MADGGQFLRGKFNEGLFCMTWGINDQIIMRRGGEPSLGDASEDCLDVCFVGPVVRGHCVWCLAIFVIFMRFGETYVGDALKSSLGGGNARIPPFPTFLLF